MDIANMATLDNQELTSPHHWFPSYGIYTRNFSNQAATMTDASLSLGQETLQMVLQSCILLLDISKQAVLGVIIRRLVTPVPNGSLETCQLWLCSSD
jgi:hypothetical protein